MFKAPASALVPDEKVSVLMSRVGPGVLSATCEADNGSTCSCKGACWAGHDSCGCVSTSGVSSQLETLRTLEGDASPR